MHTVIQDVCTGCQQCVSACSQGCLSVTVLTPEPAAWYWPKPKTATAV
jgi:electron transport complex protein RnfB